MACGKVVCPLPMINTATLTLAKAAAAAPDATNTPTTHRAHTVADTGAVADTSASASQQSTTNELRGANSRNFLKRFRSLVMGGVAETTCMPPHSTRGFASAAQVQRSLGGSSAEARAFAYFVAEQRPLLLRVVRADRPGGAKLSRDEVQRRLRAAWTGPEMGEPQKAPYKEAASREAERFFREKARLRYERLLEYREQKQFCGEHGYVHSELEHWDCDSDQDDASASKSA